MSRARPPDPAVVFYRCTGEEIGAPSEPPAGVTVDDWHPAWHRARPHGLPEGKWLAWWAFDRFRVFANRDYSVVLLHDTSGAVVHRSAVFPRQPRFPFMADDDLQVGDVWTAPAWRGQGLATFALTYVVATRVRAGRRFWYVTEAGNQASRRMVEQAGFAPIGTGRRTPRWGSRILGAYTIEREGGVLGPTDRP